QPGNGQVWKLDFSGADTATESKYGLQFPSSPTDFSHAGAITRDLSNPSSPYPLVICGDQGGNNSYLVRVRSNPDGFDMLATNGPVQYSNGVVMGNGSLYGSNTLFLCNIAHGGPPPGNPIIDAQISILNMASPGQQSFLQHSVGGYFSDPAGPCIYHLRG